MDNYNTDPSNADITTLLGSSSPWDNQNLEALQNSNQYLLNQRLERAKNKEKLKVIILWSMLGTLWIQHTFFFTLTGVAYAQGQLKELAWILGTLTTATLIQSFLVMSKISEAVFSDNDDLRT